MIKKILKIIINIIKSILVSGLVVTRFYGSYNLDELENPLNKKRKN